MFKTVLKKIKQVNLYLKELTIREVNNYEFNICRIKQDCRL